MSVTIAQVVFLAVSVALGVIILLQQSKSSGMGASLGGGASSTIFGAKGSGSFLYKTTRALAAAFFVSALLLGYLQNRSANQASILEKGVAVEKNIAPELDGIPTSADNDAPAMNTELPEPADNQPAS